MGEVLFAVSEELSGVLIALTYIISEAFILHIMTFVVT